uniref:Uncharacterized protein n=1 Tax=Ananas comosus var. bracteatus TaxID=296719 RepID=A0A6V7QA71_ANACO|nr:unnamed protein product [Ananas comosus var. bracteatus]
MWPATDAFAEVIGKEQHGVFVVLKFIEAKVAFLLSQQSDTGSSQVKEIAGDIILKRSSTSDNSRDGKGASASEQQGFQATETAQPRKRRRLHDRSLTSCESAYGSSASPERRRHRVEIGDEAVALPQPPRGGGATDDLLVVVVLLLLLCREQRRRGAGVDGSGEEAAEDV